MRNWKKRKRARVYTAVLLLSCMMAGFYGNIGNKNGIFVLAQKTQQEMEIRLGESQVFQEAETQPGESQEADQPQFQLYAKSAVLMDAESGRVLYEKNGYEHMPNASTTKIMTCILALEEGDLGDKVQISSYAASMPQVRLGMSAEDSFLLKDLLYSLMLESHNDSAVAIAEHIGGTVEGFAEKMNQKAKELGCKDTYFITPNGLDASDETGVHGTTAEDLAKIMSYCIQNERFLEITRTPNYQFTNQAGTKHYNCVNHNAFLQMMEGALSGKTGFTGNAGYCYVGALQRDDRTFVVALLACGWPNNKTYKWSDTKTLMTYGLEKYYCEDVYEYDKEFPLVKVEQAEPENGRLYQEVKIPVAVKEERIRVLKRTDEEIRTIYDMPQSVKAPVKEGQQIGRVLYYLGERQIAEVPIYSQKAVKELKPSWYKNFLLELFFMEREMNFDKG